MKAYKLILTIMLIFANGFVSLHAQGEENYWVFGRGYSLDFNTLPPTLVDTRPSMETFSYHNSIAISDDAGTVLFFVHLWAEHLQDGSSPQLFDRYENPIPNSNLLGNQRHAGPPIVIPHGSNPNLYYIFYTRDRSLLYTLFDVSLRGGLGDIVQGEKNKMLSGYGTVSGGRKTAVQGCNGVWLVIRSHNKNEYYSYLVDKDGLHQEKIVSEVGLNPLLSYQIDESILLCASPNGNVLVTGFGINKDFNVPGGIELYDFEKCSGKLLNPRILESGISTYGYCFSPDNSKLYVSQNDNPTPTGKRHIQGYVYQYDFSLTSIAAIAASKTLILTNPYTIDEVWPYGCNFEYHIGLGDIKAGPDGKLYLLNQSPVTCRENSSPLPLPSPLTHNPGMAFHIIHNPNQLGMASNPEVNAMFNSVNGMVSGFLQGSRATLPTDYIKQPPPLDTTVGLLNEIIICFKEQVLLDAPIGMSCYLWNDGTESRHLSASAPGTYWVHYYTPDCRIMVDSYHVSFIPLPNIPTNSHGCSGAIAVNVANKTSDTTTYQYLLTSPNGQKWSAISNAGYNFFGLQSGGIWLMRVTTSSGCDTTIKIHIEQYPQPSISVLPQDTIIHIGNALQLQADGAFMYTWWPRAALDTHNIPNPLAMLSKSTRFEVIGWNEYGCKDTAHVYVQIDDAIYVQIPNAFTPNGDGLNDVFRIISTGQQRLLSFRIYNRYGKEVYSCLGDSCAWDGRHKGMPTDAGVYFYMVEIALPNGNIELRKGDVTLMR
jgi:gliding motility-associated-like protein